MASYLGVSPRTTACATRFPHQKCKHRRSFAFNAVPRNPVNQRSGGNVRIRALDDGDSYLDMWKKAVDREKKEVEFQKLAENLANVDNVGDNEEKESNQELEKKTEEFEKILEVPKDERDRIQKMQVIDRAAAAISAARGILDENNPPAKNEGSEDLDGETDAAMGPRQGGTWGRRIFVPRHEASGTGTPGPDFWSWTPQDDDRIPDDENKLQAAANSSVYPISANPVIQKERSVDSLSIPFESKLDVTNKIRSLPPFQSLIEVEKKEHSDLSPEIASLNEEHDINVIFAGHAAEAAHALDTTDEISSYGVNPDGSKWWRETGVEERPDGVICRWTMTRGVSADQSVEWQEKYWEAADDYDYKELGSEKSGRDTAGNVWREFWQESMSQERGLVHLEKTADKWGKNGKGDEWQEKWWEHYDASGQAEKWAHKWCSIDPNTNLEAGHAHVWHERWGEKYDGHGGSMKYTDKWAERSEGDGWTKWGDKWDERFDADAHGVKQGETWWEGKHGERWNRTWGEQHNGSGWVHKYGKSSSGEHWDTHLQQETWYERYPHYGFYHCFDNSVQLRQVRKPSETS